MTRKLVICEKPSVGRDIAQYLKALNKHDGFLSNDEYAITWAFGHLLELKEPEDYNKEWKSWRIETLPLNPAKFELRPRKDKGIKEQLNIIKKLAQEADEIICATDSGREGELIFRYIQHYLKFQKKPFKRLWISSLTHEAIAEGFKNLKEGSDFDPLYHAAKCRSEADWIVGINATRYFTYLYGGNSLYSLGRVQTPVLSMIVERDREIENFVESEFWELHTLFKNIRFKSVRGKIETLSEAEEVKEALAKHELEISSINSKKESVLPPYLFDLTELQKEMNKKHHLSADTTLKAAQSLYEKKHITYPRTDSKFLTADVAKQLPQLLEKLKPFRKEEIERLDLNNLNLGPRIVNDLKVTDHHAIIPTTVIPKSRMSEEETYVYRALLTRLFAALYPAGQKLVTQIKAYVGEEEFKATHTNTIDLGWEVLYPKASKKSKSRKTSDDDDTEDTPEDFSNYQALHEGQRGPHTPEIKTQKTKAPLAYTEATLLQMMESAGRKLSDADMKQAIKDKGLGTPATRASIIETLVDRKYITRSKKGLTSSASGKKLIDHVQDSRLKSPELTAEWEYLLKQIENSEYDNKTFMSEVQNYVKSIVSFGKDSLGLGPCPTCQSPVIEGNKAFGCSSWKTGCKFVLPKEYKNSSLSNKIIAQLLRLNTALEPFMCFEGEIQKYVLLSLDAQGTIQSKPCDPTAEQLQNQQKADKSNKKIGHCPLCKAAVLETSKAFGCSRWKEGCKFAIWKTIAKRKVSTEEAITLLEQGKTNVLEGFQSKEGKNFQAQLILNQGQISFSHK